MRRQLCGRGMIKVGAQGQTFHTAAEGDGPVNALDNHCVKP
jgi:hypothetical protein